MLLALANPQQDDYFVIDISTFIVQVDKCESIVLKICSGA